VEREIRPNPFKNLAGRVDATCRHACEGVPTIQGKERVENPAMRVDVQPLVGERDRLENKRDRLRELLADGSISDQMRVWLRQSLGEVDQRLAMLLAGPVEEHLRRQAA
jgi:hypothetical protein